MGDSATSRSGFFNPMGFPANAGGLVPFFEGGYYNDKLVRTAVGWRIAERVEESSYLSDVPRDMAHGITAIYRVLLASGTSPASKRRRRKLP